jgi:hypothetical protein
LPASRVDAGLKPEERIALSAQDWVEITIRDQLLDHGPESRQHALPDADIRPPLALFPEPHLGKMKQSMGGMDRVYIIMGVFL